MYFVDFISGNNDTTEEHQMDITDSTIQLTYTITCQLQHILYDKYTTPLEVNANVRPMDCKEGRELSHTSPHTNG